MGRRSSCGLLPPHIREELDRLLIEGRLTEKAICEHINRRLDEEEGYPNRISKSALNRYSIALMEALRKKQREKELLSCLPPETAVVVVRQMLDEASAPKPKQNERRGKQMAVIKQALLAGLTINSVWAAAHGAGWRLASDIHRLRRSGWPVQTTRRHRKGLADYTLPRGWIPPLPPDKKKPR